ncbi:hypothetical protein C8F01DRAFT_1367331 [Mycena amicta]|nr:hypothetical protein C8F01DRAFT_1367331 [Mycena amicta]
MSTSRQPTRTYATATAQGVRGAAATPPLAPPTTKKVAKKSAVPGPRVGDMQLRGLRARQPGLPDMPGTKRTSDEVREEKAAKAAEQQKVVDDHERAVTSAAVIGHRISEEDASRKANAHRPAEVSVARMSRRRPETAVAAKPVAGPSGVTPAPRKSLVRGTKTAAAIRQANRSPPIIDPFEGDATDDEYQPPPEPLAVDEPSEGDVMDASEEEIEAKRAELANAGQKRAASVARLSPATVSTKMLRLDFAALKTPQERGRSSTPSAASLMRGRSSSSGVSSMHAGSGRGRSTSSGAGDYERDDDGIGYGGIDSDADDMGEREAARTSTAGGRAARKNSQTAFATIVETVVPGVVVPASRHVPAAQRARGRTNHNLDTLPLALRDALTKDVFPHAVEAHFTANPNPWTEISRERVFELYTEVTTDDHPMERDARVQKTMHHQVVQKFHTFRNKMASMAVEIVPGIINAYAEKEGLTPAQAVGDLREIVHPAMEIPAFCFREVEYDADGGVFPRGLYQSEGVLRVFSAFCGFTKRSGALGPIYFKQNDPATCPRGALVLAVQALKRAFNYSTSGTPVLTKSSTTGFSKANWDDHWEYPEGVKTPVASTSSIVACVEQLTAEQWRRIVKSAQVFAGSSSNTADHQDDDVGAIAQIWRQNHTLSAVDDDEEDDGVMSHSANDDGVMDYDANEDEVVDNDADDTMVVDDDTEQVIPGPSTHVRASAPSPAPGS